MTTEDEETIMKIDEIINNFKITPEMLKECERVSKELGKMSAEDWFREFTI